MLVVIIMITGLLYEVLSIATNTLVLAHTRCEYEKQYQVIRAIHDRDVINFYKKKELINTIRTSIQSKKNNSYEANSFSKKTKKEIIIQTDLKKQAKIVASLSTAL